MLQFRLLNILVNIHPTFWIFVCIFCFDPDLQPWQMLTLFLILFFSLLFHEYGHALAAKKLGRSPEITLEGFGGYASYDARGISEKHEFIITLCGPLFTAILIGIARYVLSMQLFTSFPMVYFFYYLMKLNIFWLFVNMSPLLPLDGGKIFQYLAIRWFGSERGRKISLIMGNITSIAGASYFLFSGSYIFAYVFLFHGWKNFQAYSSEKKNGKTNEFSTYNIALSAIQNSEIDQAQVMLEKLIKSKNEYVRIRSIESLALILEQKGNQKAAYEMLKGVDPNQMKQGKWILCKLAYIHKNYNLFKKFAGEIYELQPTFETAALNAKALSLLGELDYSIGWLNTALQFKNISEEMIRNLLNDPALDPIRESPEFLDRKSFSDHRAALSFKNRG